MLVDMEGNTVTLVERTKPRHRKGKRWLWVTSPLVPGDRRAFAQPPVSKSTAPEKSSKAVLGLVLL